MHIFIHLNKYIHFTIAKLCQNPKIATMLLPNYTTIMQIFHSCHLFQPLLPTPLQSWCHGRLHSLLLVITESITPVSSYVAHHQYSKQTLLVDHWLSTPLPLLLLAAPVLSVWQLCLVVSSATWSPTQITLHQQVQHHIIVIWGQYIVLCLLPSPYWCSWRTQ